MRHFIKKVTAYQCIRYLRKKVRNRRLVHQFERLERPIQEETRGKVHTMGTCMRLIRKEREDLVLETLEDLDPRAREYLVRFYFDGQRYREIADELEVSLGTVCGGMAKSLEKLRRRADVKVLMHEYEGMPG